MAKSAMCCFERVAFFLVSYSSSVDIFDWLEDIC